MAEIKLIVPKKFVVRISLDDAFFEALADVQKLGNLPIPLEIRNAPTSLMKNLGYGKGYERYTNEDLMPEKLKNKKYLPEKKSGNDKK